MSKKANYKKSFVWDYFTRKDEIATCNMCQCAIRNKNKNTSCLIRHLVIIHKIKRDGAVKISKELLVQPSSFSSLGKPVMENKSHPNVIIKDEDLEGSTAILRSSKKSQMDNIEPLGNMEISDVDSDSMSVSSNSHPANLSKTTHESNVSQTASTYTNGKISTHIGVYPQSSATIEPCVKSNNSYAVHISNNTQVSSFDQTETANSVTLGHVESRTVSSSIAHQDCASLNTVRKLSNVRDDRNENSREGMDINVPIDNERRFDHQYSKKSGAKIVRLSKASNGTCNDISTGNKIIKEKNNAASMPLNSLQVTCSHVISDQEEDFTGLEIQVPLQNVQNYSSEVKRGNNGPPFTYEYIKIEKAGEKQNVGLIILNRPKALNALCDELMRELDDAVKKFDKDESVGSIVITGSEKAFAAGSDLTELANVTFSQTIKSDFMSHWATISNVTKPVIAAVNGYALGGGCELAVMCDIIYAGHKACFGQPEVILGYLPNHGGTQRLTRILGKSKAMEMILTGSQITAQEAEKLGLVSKVFPADQLLTETIKLGEKISLNSQLTMTMAKQAVNTAYETTLHEGLQFEKRLSYAMFATADMKEGLNAFMEKRTPKFSNQ